MEALNSCFQQKEIRKFDGDENEWINLARVTMICRKRNQISSQVSFIRVFSLEHRAVKRRGEDIVKRVDFTIVKTMEIKNLSSRPQQWMHLSR